MLTKPATSRSDWTMDNMQKLKIHLGPLLILAIIAFGFINSSLADQALPVGLCGKALEANFDLTTLLPIATQCKGTCYFEAPHSQASKSATLQRDNNSEITLSRVYSMGHLLIKRATAFVKTFENPTFEPSGYFDRYMAQKLKKPETANKIVSASAINILSNGSVQTYLEVFKQKGYLIRPKPSRQEVEDENKIIQNMDQKIIALLGVFRFDLQQQNSIDGKKQLRAQTIINIETAINDELHDHIESLQIIDMLIPSSVRENKETVAAIEFTEQDPKSKTHRLNFPPEFQESLRERLDFGEEILLSYVHIDQFSSPNLINRGTLDIPPDYGHKKYPSKADHNAHLVSVISYILDDVTGDIKYLITKNSWGPGSKKTNAGYNLITPTYVRHYGNYFSQILFESKSH